jgi:RNA polymerase sigma-70 factor (ECF subfamily)
VQLSAPTELSIRELFETHYVSVWRLLRRLGVEAASLDDAAQETFWIAARKRQDIESGKERSFLFGVARRVASTHRRQAARLRVVAGAEELACPAPSPEDLNAAHQARQLLSRVLDMMPTELRAVLVFAVLEELPLLEVARIENVPLGTVNSRLRRARETFSTLAKRVRAASDYGGRTR